MLHEIQTEIFRAFNMEIAESMICRTLHQLQFSRKKMCIAATQQDEMLRALFASEVGYAFRKYGYGWREKPVLAHKLLVRGQHFSTIAFMSTAGLLDCATVTGRVNGDMFY